MAAPPRLQMHIGDYYRKTPAINRASWEHHGIYLLSLFIAWNVPGVRLPNDKTFLAERFGCAVDDVDQHVMPVIRRYYKLRKGFWYQDRLTEEKTYVAIQSAKQSTRAKVRWEKEKDTCRGNATVRNAPIPTPIQVSSSLSDRGEYEGRAKPKTGAVDRLALNGSRTTVGDPNVRLGLFMKKIAQTIGDHGWAVVVSATDHDDPGFLNSVARCQDAARQIGKGWPRNWPTDGKYFTNLNTPGPRP